MFCPCAARLPGYTIHLLGGSAFLPRLPAPLQYGSLQGGIVAVLASNTSDSSSSSASSNGTSMAMAGQVPFQATLLGVSPAYTALTGSPALSPAPANFTAPALTGLNVTYFGETLPSSRDCLALGFNHIHRGV